RQVLAESRKQLKVSQAEVRKARIDVKAAEARVLVTKRGEERLAALVGYTSIHAPYDGVVVDRNVNTRDYVQPASGAQSAPRSIQQRGKSTGPPLYVVARTDQVRIFLDVPEMDANGVRAGSKVTVRIPALDDEEVSATVTRTSWALHAQTRTLRAE